MNFYTFLNSINYKDFVVDEISELEMALVCFNSDNKMDFIKIAANHNSIIMEEHPNEYCLYAIGEDGFRYSFRLEDGDCKKCGRFSMKKLYKFVEKQKAFARQVTIWNQKIANAKGNNIVEEKSTIGKYKRFCYVDKQNKRLIKFRFKCVDCNKKLPLLVYFHGAGCLGEDNTKPLLEFASQGVTFLPEKCHILLPQAQLGDNQGAETINVFVDVVKNIIDDLIKKHNIDTDRIYIVGTSFGGACVWSSLYNYPTFYAGGIPVMGSLLVGENEINIDNLANQSIWIAHSANDTNMIIKDDDKLFDMLKNKNANVKYTRWKRLGHNMSSFFYRFTKWKKWLFQQKRKGLDSKLS